METTRVNKQHCYVGIHESIGGSIVEKVFTEEEDAFQWSQKNPEFLWYKRVPLWVSEE